MTLCTELWESTEGRIAVPVDSHGCPTGRKYCKTQGGGETLLIGTGAVWQVTVALPNFIEARIVGFVLQAYSILVGNADELHNQIVTGIRIQGDDQLGNGIVGAERYRTDARGSGDVGSSQYWQGLLGTRGGVLVIDGQNLGGATVNIVATVDVEAIRE